MPAGRGRSRMAAPPSRHRGQLDHALPTADRWRAAARAGRGARATGRGGPPLPGLDDRGGAAAGVGAGDRADGGRLSLAGDARRARALRRRAHDGRSPARTCRCRRTGCWRCCRSPGRDVDRHRGRRDRQEDRSVYRTYGAVERAAAGARVRPRGRRRGRIWAATTSNWLVLDGERWVPAGAALAPGRSGRCRRIGRRCRSVAAGRRRDQRGVRWTIGRAERLWVLDGGLLHDVTRGEWQTFPSPVPQVVLPAPLDAVRGPRGQPVDRR